MKKILWLTSSILIAVLFIAGCLTAYFIHSLPFSMRIDCATGVAPYNLISPVCHTYIKLIDLKDTQEDRQKTSANLTRLLSIYHLDKGRTSADRALTMADEFIALGADIDFVDTEGLTPLHAAVLHAEPELVEFLLHYKADPHKRSLILATGKTLSPVELAILMDKKAKNQNDENWKRIRSLLKLSTNIESPTN